MTRKALVAQVEDTWVKLFSIDEEEEREGCGTSPHSESCHSTGCSCRITGRPMKAALPTEIRVAPGDTVEVTFSGFHALAGFLAVILAPVAVGWGFWSLGSRVGMARGWQVGVAILSIFLTLCLLIFLRSGKSSLPRITGLVESGRELEKERMSGEEL